MNTITISGNGLQTALITVYAHSTVEATTQELYDTPYAGLMIDGQFHLLVQTKFLSGRPELQAALDAALAEVEAAIAAFRPAAQATTIIYTEDADQTADLPILTLARVHADESVSQTFGSNHEIDYTPVAGKWQVRINGVRVKYLAAPTLEDAMNNVRAYLNVQAEEVATFSAAQAERAADLAETRNRRASYKREIKYDRETKDYGLYLDGELVGYACTVVQGERTLDALVFELLNSTTFPEVA